MTVATTTRGGNSGTTVPVLWPSPDDFIPSTDLQYVDVHGLLEDSLELAVPKDWAAGRPDAPGSSNLLFVAPQGLGKSLLTATLAQRAAERLGKPVPMVTYECNEDTRDYHLRGGLQIEPGGATYFVPGPFPTAIHFANEVGCCILNAEEISTLSPGAQKMFNSMTDWRKSIYIPQTATSYKLKPGCRIIVLATMNPSGFGGVYTLNPDLRSRFDERIVPYPGQKQEEQILARILPFATKSDLEKATKLAKECRTDEFVEYRVSTRDLYQLISNIRKLGDEAKALAYLLDKFEGSERNTLKDRIKATYTISL